MAYRADFLNQIYQQAEEKHNFASLVGYPYLLFSWQVKHKEDSMKISAIASHKLGKHHFCKTDDICKTIQAMIDQNAPEGGKLL